MSSDKHKGQAPNADNAREADEISDEALESVAGGCRYGCSVPNSDDFLKIPDYDSLSSGGGVGGVENA